MPGRDPLSRLVRRVSSRARARRGRLFVARIAPCDRDRILDLGGGDGSHLASLVPFRSNVCVADISEASLETARGLGFRTAVLPEKPPLPFADRAFDVVFCSSVIEHATLEKAELLEVSDTAAFREQAFAQQRRFAEEIRRISDRYFVQTPYRYFPIESHTWLPALILLLPRRQLIRLIAFMNRWWPKKTRPDWNLLTRRQMRELFPDATLLTERWFGLPKSLIAIRGVASASPLAPASACGARGTSGS